jgi:hypothetical protein
MIALKNVDVLPFVPGVMRSELWTVPDLAPDRGLAL